MKYSWQNISKAYYKKEYKLQLKTLAAILFKYQDDLSKFRTDTGFFKGYKSLLHLRRDYKQSYMSPKLTQLPYKFENASEYFTKIKLRENKWEQTPYLVTAVKATLISVE